MVDTNPDTRVIGENFRRESKRSYAAFLDYCNMGTGRSLRKLFERYDAMETPPTKSFPTIANWSKNFFWVERAAAWDAMQQEKARNAYEQRWREMIMSGDEVIGRLSEQSRASIAEFITIKWLPLKKDDDDDVGDESATEAGDLIQVVELNWLAIRERGHLIKAITNTRYGPRIEMHDGQVALVHVGRHHKLFTDQQQVSGTIEHTGDKAEHERFDRAISTLAEALREIVPGAGAKTESSVAPTE